MRIIENNYKSTEITKKQITCKSCKSVIEYDNGDLTLEFWESDQREATKYKGFACPCCDKNIGVKILYAR